MQFELVKLLKELKCEKERIKTKSDKKSFNNRFVFYSNEKIQKIMNQNIEKFHEYKQYIEKLPHQIIVTTCSAIAAEENSEIIKPEREESRNKRFLKLYLLANYDQLEEFFDTFIYMQNKTKFKRDKTILFKLSDIEKNQIEQHCKAILTQFLLNNIEEAEYLIDSQIFSMSSNISSSIMFKNKGKAHIILFTYQKTKTKPIQILHNYLQTNEIKETNRKNSYITHSLDKSSPEEDNYNKTTQFNSIFLIERPQFIIPKINSVFQNKENQTLNMNDKQIEDDESNEVIDDNSNDIIDFDGFEDDFVFSIQDNELAEY